jgi:hypothetical protein
VINLPDENYQVILTKIMLACYGCKIKELKKGHRRLITEPTEEEIEKIVGGQNDFAGCIRDSVKAVFDNVPTIIEADKSEEV